MTDELKHVSINGRITRAAPHPQGAQLNPREYYMADRGGNDLGLLAYPGATHVIVYWLDTSSMTPRICYEVCETVRAAERALSEHSKEFSDLRPEGIVTQLEKTLEAARKLAAPKPRNHSRVCHTSDKRSGSLHQTVKQYQCASPRSQK